MRQSGTRPAADVRDAAVRFGKVGLLIDDSAQANERLARELYGAERLPGWWVVVGTVTAALRPLEELPPGIPLVLVVDRYLPVAPKQRAVAWDQRQKDQPCLALRGKLEELRDQRSDSPAYFERFVTSFPHGRVPTVGESPREPGSPFPWRRRTSESLADLRPQIIASDCQGLLRYGPEVGAEGGREWQEVLKGLAEALVSEEDEVFLLTGGGVSMAEGRFGPGMPPMGWLMVQACRVAGSAPGSLFERMEMPPPSEWPPAPELLGQSIDRIATVVGAVKKMDEAGDEEDRSAWKRWTFLLPEVFFFEERTPQYLAFRALLHHFDRGFPYHAWLAAQLPWTAWTTGNVDRFVERAAGAVLEDHEAGSWAGASALRVSEVGDERAQPTDVPVLFKPLGSLASTRGIAPRDERQQAQLKTTVTNLGERLLGMAGDRRAWLVVVGSRVDDRFVVEVLAKRLLEGLTDRLTPVWVDPWATRLRDNEQDRNQMDWCKAVRGRGWALDSRALDFFYDLKLTFDALDKPAPSTSAAGGRRAPDQGGTPLSRFEVLVGKVFGDDTTFLSWLKIQFEWGRTLGDHVSGTSTSVRIGDAVSRIDDLKYTEPVLRKMLKRKGSRKLRPDIQALLDHLQEAERSQ